ncbi:hypothetical protein [Nocardiopsis synnemataformans]|uniref:hypothetical protein n=1 Tax=Nocardiopsis synnemataformans TaxID=61305 RepID=UPI003EBAC1E0
MPPTAPDATPVAIGQHYASNTSKTTIRVLNIDHDYYLGPSAWVENTTTPRRQRWVSLRKLHTDGRTRRTGYSLLTGRSASNHATAVPSHSTEESPGQRGQVR